MWISFDALAVPAVAILARRAQREVEDRTIPLMGVMGAFIFAAQMINFPVGPGTSGHLVGGALLAIVLGPAAAAMVMTAILAIQALVFQDGGILALGANVFNMAIVGVIAGYLPYRLLKNSAGAFVGGLVSVLASACLALAELADLRDSDAAPGFVGHTGIFHRRCAGRRGDYVCRGARDRASESADAARLRRSCDRACWRPSRWPPWRSRSPEF